MSTTLVTGGSGFIGSHIVEELLNRGHSVRVLDNFATGKKQNLITMKAELIKGDIRNLEIVKKAVKGADYVFHEAAIASVTKSIEDPVYVNDVNVNGTLNVLKSSMDSNVKKVVFASSSSVYGNVPKNELPVKEDHSLSPMSPYAVTKFVGEQYCRVFYENYGLESVCLRYFNVYGPRQDPNSEYAAVIPKFIEDAKNNQSPTIFGDGKQTRDFVFVKDVVKANILSMNFKGFGIFNVCLGKSISLNEVAGKILKECRKKLQPIYSDERKGDVKHSLGDPSLANKTLNFKAEYAFEEGLKETIKASLS